MADVFWALVSGGISLVIANAIARKYGYGISLRLAMAAMVADAYRAIARRVVRRTHRG